MKISFKYDFFFKTALLIVNYHLRLSIQREITTRDNKYMPNNNEETNQEVTPGQAQLDSSLTQKIKYLQTLQSALHEHDDRQIYELIDKPRYDREVKKSRSTTKTQNLADLVANDHEQLSHYLSENLIDYLGKTYPFFYYDEVRNGEFDIYFGNWWDRRKFGKLDVLNVAFEFDETEYGKLKRSFELDALNQRYNTDNIAEISANSAQLQKLIDGQDERDQLKKKRSASSSKKLVKRARCHGILVKSKKNVKPLWISCQN